jgi:hypothetical protein
LFAANPHGWTRNSPMPGHGVQLRNGRLLMPFNHRAPDPDPNYGVDNRASNAPYTINHTNGTTTIRVDQRSHGGQWITLGAFTFTAGQPATIELSDAGRRIRHRRRRARHRVVSALRTMDATPVGNSAHP